jgi:glycosyltransferase involved in cell wall biosynthesis
MLAGDYRGAARAYMSLLRRHPGNFMAWGKLLRWLVFLSAPAARPLCFSRKAVLVNSVSSGSAAPPEFLAGGGQGARRTRVLFVIPGEMRGCSMIFARREVRAVGGQGVDTHVFYLRSRTAPRGLCSEFRRFRKELGRLRPQVVHAHFGTMTALFAALGSRGIPLVITYRGSDLNPAPGPLGQRLHGWLSRGLSQLAALAAHQIVCVSAQLRHRLLWHRDRAVVLPDGVDPKVFYPRPRAEARRDLGWTGDGPVILFNAGFNPRIKRLALAEAAVARARLALPALHMEVLNGGCPPDLMPSYMNAADCLLLTSYAEGSPTVLKEALACNLPVVSVDVGDAAERIRGVRGTRLVAPDPESLANALIELVAHPTRSDGRRKLHEFSAAGVAAELCGIYRRLAAPGLDRSVRSPVRAVIALSRPGKEPLV